jgi:hypothetical protein
MDRVPGGRLLPVISTPETAIIGWRPPYTVLVSILTVQYIYTMYSLPVGRRSSKRCLTNSEYPFVVSQHSKTRHSGAL